MQSKKVVLEHVSGPHKPDSPFGAEPYRAERGRKSINMENKDHDSGYPLERRDAFSKSSKAANKGALSIGAGSKDFQIN